MGSPRVEHPVAQEHDAACRVRRQLAETVPDGGPEIGAVATHLGTLGRRQARLRAQGVLDGRARPERERADAILVAHAELGHAELGGDARLGVRHQIDAAAAVDRDEHAQAVEGPTELDTGHGSAESEERERRQELAEDAPRTALAHR